MVSEGELAERVSEVLRSSDLATTTTAAVRRRLEQEFSVDLSDKKAFLRRQVDLFLQSRAEDEADEEEEAAAAAAAMAEDEGAGEGDEEGSLRSEGSGSESVEDEEEEEESRSRRIGKKKVSKMSKESNKRGSGFSKLCSLSPLLQKILGVSEMARPEVVKQLWVYIREKNLQDPGNRRNIKCDETLRELFHVDSINMFQMNKVLSKHIWPFESGVSSSSVASAKSLQKEKQKKQEREGSDEIVPKEKRQKGALSGFLAPLPLSDALVKFLGTGESTLSRSDVVKRMWDYIRKNNLQDPADKRRIICDDKLKELFEVDSFNGFTVPKLLASHYIKAQQ